MSKSYVFSGHALGVAAQFHSLDEAHNLDHVVPTLGASVLAPTGGHSRSRVIHYAYSVDQPRKRTLLSVRKIKTAVSGRDLGNRFETEIEADIEAVRLVEKLHIGAVRLHVLSAVDAESEDAKPVVTTKGSHIHDLQLGTVAAEVVLDEEPLLSCGNAKQLAEFYYKQTEDYRKKYGWRFALDTAPEIPGKRCLQHKFSLVREIRLTGPERDKQPISVDGYTIYWKGFGKIILGEVQVKCNDRRVTMVRLAMGSDAGGSGTAGGGQSNGGTG
ncbi:MAG: hypothetical protein WB579_11765 [Bryobacteraceae bacterium]